MSKLSKWMQIGIFCLFILLCSLSLLFLPDREFSETENRILAAAPQLSSLSDGSFADSFDSYICDQFPLRDFFVELKARCEFISGKKENNGVYLCGDTLIERFDEADAALTKRNLDAVNSLAACGKPVYFSLIPSSAEIYSALLPENAPSADQEKLIAELYSDCSALTVSNLEKLKAHSKEYIYYRTDHHWTSLGAYYGYEALCEAMGLTAAPLGDEQLLSNEFYGTVYSSSGVHWTAPDSISCFVKDPGVKLYADEKLLSFGLYDTSHLDVKDKYSLFLGGDYPSLRIDTGASGPVLLILKDSYINSELPYLISHFSQIHLIDLRYYKSSVKAYIETNSIDEVLVSYSLANFTSDINIFLAGR